MRRNFQISSLLSKPKASDRTAEMEEALRTAEGPRAPDPAAAESGTPMGGPDAMVSGETPTFAPVPDHGKPIYKTIRSGTYKLKGGGSLVLTEHAMAIDLTQTGDGPRKGGGQVVLRHHDQLVVIAFGIAGDATGDEAEGAVTPLEEAKPEAASIVEAPEPAETTTTTTEEV